MKILVIDNYDSFTYNLVQYFRELTTHPVTVVRNDALPVAEVAAYDVIVLSPGPGLPQDAGIMPEVILTYQDQKPILGVCLGHQAIGEAFGGRLQNLSHVYHGVATPVHQIAPDMLLDGLSTIFEAGRYHSWVVDKDTLPAELICLAKDVQGEIMALRHQTRPIWGVQFHPESILTPEGKRILANFLQYCEQNIKPS